ncbi:alpha beta hydrolase protein [Podospora aff. communis PSN243]|uniref:Alpha beta hydrolase protein n=1 Tax=Podospora aff. communis PSN243 TaxID=3040156 RepID=A0AAV9GCK8_9PEZI|nr:alpha beta hydrolase protein [Podospora aff. communis PSN243]
MILSLNIAPSTASHESYLLSSTRATSPDPFTMPFFNRTPLISLYYLDEGPSTAPVILLIPGLTCDLHDWSWQVPFLLSLGYRTISLDVRGQGRSSAPLPTPNLTSWPGPNAPANIIDYYPQTCAHDAAALLDHLGVKSVIAIGHSQGDLITYHLATLRPDLVRALVGIDGIYRWDNAAREANGWFFEQKDEVVQNMIGFFTYTYPPDAPAWMKAWHARRAKAMDPEVMFALCWGGWGDREDGLGRTEVAVRQWKGRLECPHLVVGSSEDAVRVDRGELWRGDKLDEIVVIEGKGHWLHQAGSERFNAVVEKWLGRVGMLPEKGVAEEERGRRYS